MTCHVIVAFIYHKNSRFKKVPIGLTRSVCNALIQIANIGQSKTFRQHIRLKPFLVMLSTIEVAKVYCHLCPKFEFLKI